MNARTLVSLTVNGRPVEATVEPRTSLADCLREQLHLTGTHVACEQGVCGACTLLVDGRPVRSCITWAVSCAGADVRTIEGFDTDPQMQQLRDAFSREHALQCGFCTPGMLMTAHDIVTRLPGCDESRVRHELCGNLCRCTGYTGIVRAVCSVASAQGAERQAEPTPAPPLPLFEPEHLAGPGEPTPAARTQAPSASEPGAMITEVIVVHGCGPDRLWALLSDVAAAASCLPGARVDQVDGQKVSGAVAVAFGPIKAEFVGEGTLGLEESARRAVIRGSAVDARSRTAAKATISYRVEPDGERADAARLVVAMDYEVQGPLAQFSRSDLVRSLVGHMLRDFGRNLEARVAGRAVTAGTRLNAFALVWGWLVERGRRLLGMRER